MDDDVIDHPKTYRLAQLLGAHRAAALGLLVGVWGYASRHHQDGDLTEVELEALHRRVGWTSAGLSADCPLGTVYEDVRDVLVEAGWADRLGSRIVLHDWYDWQGKLVERRAKDRERKQLERSGRPQDTARTVCRTRNVSAGQGSDGPQLRHVTGRKSPPTPPSAFAPPPESVAAVAARITERLTS